MKDKLKAWAFGNLVLSSIIGTANIAAFSLYDRCLKIEIQYNPAMTEQQVKAAEYIMDNGIEDPTKLCSSTQKKKTG